MKTSWEKVRRIFNDALKLAPSERASFLDEVCDGEIELRREVESLLTASENDDSFLEKPLIEKVEDFNETKQLQISNGSCFNHYEIIKQIGAGGMGEVYLAKDRKLERQVAIKILNEKFAKHESNLQRFIQEAKSASALNHPNILVIHEIGESENTHYIVSEYIEGETLREVLNRKTLKLAEVLDISIQIANALSTAHVAKIIHRDIKPENIIIRSDGLAKILDFGLAKLVEEKTKSLLDLEQTTAKQSNTAKGVILGTVNYMSPEQAKGEKVDERTDIFSFGVCLYEMIAGKTPFAGESVSETFANLINAEPQPLSRFSSNIPDELNRIVSKTLRKNKDERYQTMKGALADLKALRDTLAIEKHLEKSKSPDNRTAILRGATNETHSTTDKTLTDRIKRRKSFAIFASVVLLIGAIVLGYYYFFSAGKIASNAKKSLAVLPFVNASQDPNAEYLSDGITENIINKLSEIAALKVMSRNSAFRFKNDQNDTKTIASELNVTTLVTGDIKQIGDRLVVNVHLIDASDDSQIWGNQYVKTSGDIIAVQNEIARDVAKNLSLKLSRNEQQRIEKRPTENVAAYRLYLQGRFYWLKFPAREFEKSRDFYEQTIKLDPNFALAYAGLSEYYGFGVAQGVLPPDENWTKSEAAAKKALELDDTLPDGYNALAGVKQFNFDQVGAEKDLLRAIELNPNYVEGRNHYSFVLAQMGRLQESFAQSKKVVELEPLSVSYNRTLAIRYFQNRDYEHAVEQFLKTLELDPNDAYTHELLGNTYEQKAMPKEAVAEWLKALRLTEEFEAAGVVERAFAESGFNATIRALFQHKLKRLEEKTIRGEFVPAMDYALVYTRIADKEKAFVWLAKAVKERNGLKFEINLDPVYNALRDDPRFQDLVRQTKIP